MIKTQPWKKLVTCLGLLISLAGLAESLPKVQKVDELPAQYHEAFKISATSKNETLEVFLEMLNNFSAYKESLEFKTSDGLELKPSQATPSLRSFDPVSQMTKEFYRNQNIFTFKAESKKILVHVQACSKTTCLLPIWIEVDVLNSAPTMTKADTFERSTQESMAEKIKTLLLANGILSLQTLLLLFLAGLITAFTPCVMPLYPITLGIFARWSHHNNRRAFALSLAYGAGIIFCYALDGLLSAATGSLFGSLTQSPAYLIGVGTVIFLSGFMFSGIIPFPFTGFLLKIAGGPLTPDEDQKPFAHQLMKSFVMGTTLGLVASPCVGPILLTLLAWLSHSLAGSTASYLKGFIALGFFGFGMALPFLILGHFYFRFHKRLQMGRFSHAAKIFGSLLLIGSSLFFLVPGVKLLLHKKQMATPDKMTSVSYENRPLGKAVVVDFRADWCEACLEIEKTIFSNEQVKSYFTANDIAFVQVDMTHPDDHQKLSDQFGIVSLPTVIILSPKAKLCKDLTLSEPESPERFIRRLEAAKAGCF